MIRKLCILMLGLLFLTAYNACDQVGGNTVDTSKFKIDYDKFTLDNGLEVILHQDKSDPIVAVAIMFHVGSNREKPGRTGFAHFFEHMLFQNSENVGKGNFFKTIEELGGDFNGGTWNDGTVYYEVVPKDALERILWMESDRMGFMINTVTVPVLENEKQVVKNEKRQRVDNQPYGHTNYVIDKTLYPEDHPYNWQVIGSLEDLQNATLEDVKDFYNKWYGPNNATMVIAGDFEFEPVKEMVKKYFEEIPAKGDVGALTPNPAKITQTVKLMHEDNFANLPELRMVFPTVEDGHPDSYALDYLGELLSQGKRAPLYKEIVEKQKLAPSTSSYNSTREIAGNFYFRVRANDGVDLDTVHQALMTALSDFEANGIDERDMERIKNSQETSFYSGITSVLSKAFQLAQYNEFRNDPGALTKEIDNILSVTKADVMRVYETYIKDKPYVMTSFVPKGQTALAIEGSAVAEVVEEPIVQGAEEDPMDETAGDFEKTPTNIDRSTPPALSETPTLNLPDIYETKLANGMEVFGIQNTELPLVEFSIRIKGGMLFDNPEKIGVANLITDIMMEGTANKTPEQLEDAIGQLGANIGMYTSSEYITITGSTLARNYSKVLDLVEEVMMEPRWDESEFERLKSKTLTSIQQQSVQPGVVAANAFSKLIYGEDNIMAYPTSGTASTVEKITLDDLKAYYEKYFSPNLASFHVAGSVSKDQVLKSLKDIETKWTNKGIELPEVAKPAAAEKPKVFFIDIPESKQSVVRIGMPSMEGNDKDYYAATVVNERLGSGTSARLFQQLREEKGYTYGAYSFIPRRINNSYFAATSSVRTNVTLESVELFNAILSGYQEDFSAEDLEKTKSTLIKGNALAFETLYDKMGILQNISTFDLPLDYIKKEEEVVTSMTLEEAKALIGKYIDPSKMIYLVVGDAKTQFERLKKAGLGDPVLIDKDAQPINVNVLN